MGYGERRVSSVKIWSDGLELELTLWPWAERTCSVACLGMRRDVIRRVERAAGDMFDGEIAERQGLRVWGAYLSQAFKYRRSRNDNI